MALRHEELTKVILESIFEVHNDIGVGLDEATYHESLLDCFLEKGVPVISKERKHLVLTAIQNQISLIDVLRMRTYLRHSDIPIGLLINFGKSNLEIKTLCR